MALHVVAWPAGSARPASPAYCPATRAAHREGWAHHGGCRWTMVCLECNYEQPTTLHAALTEYRCPILGTRVLRCEHCIDYREFVADAAVNTRAVR